MKLTKVTTLISLEKSTLFYLYQKETLFLTYLNMLIRQIVFIATLSLLYLHLSLFIPTKDRSQTAPLPPSSNNDRTPNPFFPPEQLFPKHRVLLGSNARSLAFSHAQEQVRALANRRLQVLTINC
jgi:hypothetical protein